MGEENSSPMEVVQRKMLEYKQQDQLLQHAQYGKTGSVDPLEWIIPETSWHDETQDVLPSEYSSDNKKENKEVKKSSQKRIKHYCSVGVCTTLARKVGGKCVRHGYVKRLPLQRIYIINFILSLMKKN